MLLQLLLSMVCRFSLAFKLQLVLPFERVLAVFLLFELVLQSLYVFQVFLLRILTYYEFLVRLTFRSLEVVDVVLQLQNHVFQLVDFFSVLGMRLLETLGVGFNAPCLHFVQLTLVQTHI